MIATIVAWALAALEDTDTGVNALRVGIPRPALSDAPPACALYSQNESAWVARAEIPAELLTRHPLLLLRQASEFEAPYLPDDPTPATVDLAILAVARGDQTHVQLVQLEQLLRTALRVIARAVPSGADATITVDGVDFSPAGRVTWLPPVTTPDTPLMLGVVLSFVVTDAWSLGI